MFAAIRKHGRAACTCGDQLRRSAAPAAVIFVNVVVAAAAFFGCDGSSQPPRQPGRPSSNASHPQQPRSHKPQAPAPQAETPTVATAEPRPEVAGLTPAMRTAATRPVALPTGLFLDRPQSTDFRLMTYNMNRDSIFPSKNPIRAEKFQRTTSMP